VRLLLMSLIFLLACERQTPTRNTAAVTTDSPDLVSWASEHEISVDGMLRAKIWAGYTAKFNRESVFYFSDSLHVDFYNEFGQHQSELFADSGLVDERTEDLRVWSNVRVISDSGIVLLAEELKWDNQRQRIYSDTAVTFLSARDTLLGDSFESDPNLTNYRIVNPRGRGESQGLRLD
jgi:LPS export ABC transporter protein LptC